MELCVLREQYKQMQTRARVQLHMLSWQCQIQERQLQELRAQLGTMHLQLQLLRDVTHNQAVYAAPNKEMPPVAKDKADVDSLWPSEQSGALSAQSPDACWLDNASLPQPSILS